MLLFKAGLEAVFAEGAFFTIAVETRLEGLFEAAFAFIAVLAELFAEGTAFVPFAVTFEALAEGFAEGAFTVVAPVAALEAGLAGEVALLVERAAFLLLLVAAPAFRSVAALAGQLVVLFVETGAEALAIGKGAAAGTAFAVFAVDGTVRLTMPERDTSLDAMVAEDVARPVRPAGVGGQAQWNDKAVWFQYPPILDFPSSDVAEEYRYIILDSLGRSRVFRCASPRISLEKIWPSLPSGRTEIWCETVKRGSHVYKRVQRTFWRMSHYIPGGYPAAPRSYAEAVELAYGYLLNMPSMRHFAETGRPDPGYWHNCYPSKMHSATIQAMIRLARRYPEHRAQAMRLAGAAADYLLSVSYPSGSSLAGFTPTYEGDATPAAKRYADEVMMGYPASVGSAFLALYGETGARKYLSAAETIAGRYLVLQEADGTWPLKMKISTGKRVGRNRLIPFAAMSFLNRMFQHSGDVRYRAAADRAFGFIENGPLSDWNWEGQFEDMEPTDKYINLTLHGPVSAAVHILQRWPDDPSRVAQARELVRFAEDQFVAWERPYEREKLTLVGNAFDDWLVKPAVVEQYHYREVVDSAAARMADLFLRLHQVTGNPLDLAKARTLADSIVRVQCPNGRIPTLWTANGHSCIQDDWINCMFSSIRTLEILADFIEKNDVRSGADNQKEVK